MNTGSALPALRLQSTQGTIDFAAYRGKANVMIYLMREFSCAMCQGHVRRLKAMAGELPGTQILVIGGGTLDQAQNLVSQMQLPFPVLADPERISYAAFGLDKILGLWQKGGTVLADKNGTIQMIHGTGNPGASLLEPELRRTLAGLPA